MSVNCFRFHADRVVLTSYVAGTGVGQDQRLYPLGM